MRRRPLMLTLAFALVAVLGYWLAGKTRPREVSRGGQPVEVFRGPANGVDDSIPKFRHGGRDSVKRGVSDAENAGALEGQRIVVFKDRAALEDFLKQSGPGIRLLGRLDSLNALRIGFSDYDELLAMMDGSEEKSFVFPVYTPAPKDGSVQDGAVAMGNNLLNWLGVSGDNSSWGKGVRIAVLDTGVTANSTFNTGINMINLVGLPSDPSAQNGHGTAVASMIIGNDSLAPGVAPSTDILSVRIADDNGLSDSFLLAKGIVAAVDAGVSLINISMGSFGDSGIVRNAIEYANERGVLIFAAAGNNGTQELTYPASNTGVIAVGAVDAMGNHLDFSNSGTSVAISAPGYGVNAAWSGDEFASVTGTSFSTPIVAGSVAAIMSQSGKVDLTAAQAWQLLTTYLNDGGAAGADAQLGAGMPDIGRVQTGNTPGVYDAAVASTRILPPDAGNPYGQVEILVQNRGTETLINAGVRVSTGAGVVSSNINSLAANAVTTVRVPITRPPTAGVSTMKVDAQVVLSGGVQDAKPSNDRRVETYAAPSGR
ncbi:MAG: S8 family serine peptidase [Verrucomicrobiota bacterium]